MTKYNSEKISNKNVELRNYVAGKLKALTSPSIAIMDKFS
jgi:hypothetical protein